MPHIFMISYFAWWKVIYSYRQNKKNWMKIGLELAEIIRNLWFNGKLPKRKIISAYSKFHLHFRHTKVNYEIKNGQPVFSIRRRSPRKLPYGTPSQSRERDPREPKTPKQLFTPSSKGDFINDFAPSPPRSRGKNLPSPVKFHVEDDRDEPENGNLSNLIESLPGLGKSW